jgi:hypothetical protein
LAFAGTFPDALASGVQGEEPMLMLAIMPIFVAAAGWAFILTLLSGGGIGTFIILFIILKLLGK